MKFEKFYKAIGTHGTIVEFDNGEKWLIGDNVGMVVPAGVNTLGIKADVTAILKAIAESDEDDFDALILTAAELKPDGKAKDIVRIFETYYDEKTVSIRNDQFGLLEKSDKLSYLEIDIPVPDSEDAIVKTEKYMIVRNLGNNIIGYIADINN